MNPGITHSQKSIGPRAGKPQTVFQLPEIDGMQDQDPILPLSTEKPQAAGMLPETGDSPIRATFTPSAVACRKSPGHPEGVLRRGEREKPDTLCRECQVEGEKEDRLVSFIMLSPSLVQTDGPTVHQTCVAKNWMIAQRGGNPTKGCCGLGKLGGTLFSLVAFHLAL